MRPLTEKQEAFVQELIKNGGNRIEAYRAAGYSQEMSRDAQRVQANKVINKPNVALRYEDLRSKALEVLEEDFKISVKERIKRLDHIYQCGIEESIGANGSKSYQSLGVAAKSVEIMNAMLGTDESGDVKPVKVQIGVVDAS